MCAHDSYVIYATSIPGFNGMYGQLEYFTDVRSLSLANDNFEMRRWFFESNLPNEFLLREYRKKTFNWVALFGCILVLLLIVVQNSSEITKKKHKKT